MSTDSDRRGSRPLFRPTGHRTTQDPFVSSVSGLRFASESPRPSRHSGPDLLRPSPTVVSQVPDTPRTLEPRTWKSGVRSDPVGKNFRERCRSFGVVRFVRDSLLCRRRIKKKRQKGEETVKRIQTSWSTRNVPSLDLGVSFREKGQSRVGRVVGRLGPSQPLPVPIHTSVTTGARRLIGTHRPCR